MRSRERLFEVIDSLNVRVVGMAAMCLRIGVNMLRTRGEVSDVVLDEIWLTMDSHESPHVRELASELLADVEGRS